MSGRGPEKWSPAWYVERPAGGEPPAKSPNVTEGQRIDRVLYSPTGEELVRIKDRPFRGYRA